jgi:hypothetical protein
MNTWWHYEMHANDCIQEHSPQNLNNHVIHECLHSPQCEQQICG